MTPNVSVCDTAILWVTVLPVCPQDAALYTAAVGRWFC